MPTNSDWSLETYVYHGRFSSPQDLDSAVMRLARNSDGIAVIAAFSGYYLLPRLSRIVTDLRLRPDLLSSLRDRLQVELRFAEDSIGRRMVVESAIKSVVEAEISRASAFGEATDQAGALGIVVATGRHDQTLETWLNNANNAALTAMCSRFAAFHRENAQELNVRGVYKAANKAVAEDPSSGELGLAALANRVTDVRLSKVLERARNLIDAESIRIYRNNGGKLDLVASIPEEELLSRQQSANNPSFEVGEDVIGLEALVNKCWTENRKLYSLLPERGSCVGWPYGAPRSLGGLQGVVAITFPEREAYAFSLYSMSLMNATVRYLERALTEEGRLWSIETIDEELRRISAGRSVAEISTDSADRADHARRDLSLTMPTIMRMLDYLASVTGSLSVTFRLLSGTDESAFYRALLRTYCAGEGCDIESPYAISLDEHRYSVNAYVATRGVPVYLRLQGAEDDIRPQPVDVSRYPGLESPLHVRSGVLSELCIPVFCESRLIGTLNLESRREFAYDLTSQVASECAQVIGIAILESRRRIGVELMYEAGGFLDRRHELERMVRELGADLENDQLNLANDLRVRRQGQIKELLEHIYLHENMLRRSGDRGATISEVFSDAKTAVSWALQIELPEVIENEDANNVPTRVIQLSADCANALKFALVQCLVNVRKQGRNDSAFALWNSPIKISLSSKKIGGQDNLYVGVSSFANKSAVAGLSGDTVFREPLVIGDRERVRLGTYISGEILRRCGGSAYFRTEESSYSKMIVTSEFSVPFSQLGLETDSSELTV